MVHSDSLDFFNKLVAAPVDTTSAMNVASNGEPAIAPSLRKNVF